MLLREIAETSSRVSGTGGRLEKIGHLADTLRRLESEEIGIGVSYLSGELRQGRIGIGYSTLEKAAPSSAAQSAGITLRDVDAAFERIAQISGRGSAGERITVLGDLLARATAEEQRFLQRLLIGELRQGAQEGLMVEAIARAADVSAADVRRAVMLAGGPTAVAEAALREGRSGLARFSLQLFRPLKPMLAQTADGVADALDQLGSAALEYKLDGARIQVHRSGDDVLVFTRKLNDVTAAVPEVVEAVRELPARELILDGEVLALREDGSPLPFQETMRRFGRKLDVAALRETLPLSSFFFDCLYIDGRSLIDLPGEERVAALSEALPGSLRVERLVTGEIEAGEAFLAAALEAGHEGIMAKALDAAYKAGGRGGAWLKIKPVHTLDLVVLAAEWGHGRRRGWLSNLHLGARDPVGGGFVMLGKTFKGLTDELLEWQTERLQELEVSRDEWGGRGEWGGTVYVRPELVVEIAFNDIQASPQYPGGFALRFARVKGYRPDKAVTEADTIDTIRSIHEGRSRQRH